MKTIAYFRCLALFLALATVSGCDDGSSFSTIDGKNHQISDFRGRWLVVNFWAEWCVPCRKEVPELNKLAAYSEGLKITVLGISFDNIANKEISRIASNWGIDYSLVSTKPMPVLPFSLPERLPTSYLVDPRGEIVQVFEGEISFESVLNTIESRSGEQKEPQGVPSQ